MKRNPPRAASPGPDPAQPAGRRPRPELLPTLACVAVLSGMGLLSACEDQSSSDAPASGAVASPTPSTADSVLPDDVLPVAEAYVSAVAELDVQGIRAVTSDTVFEAAYHAGPEPAVQWWAATGFVLIPDGCHSASAPAVVRCDYEFHGLRSKEMGLGPYGGSHVDLTVESGRVVSIDDQIAYMDNGFSEQVWEPFVTWMEAKHPKDVAVMYEPDLSEAIYSATSSMRWKARTAQYVAEQG